MNDNKSPISWKLRRKSSTEDIEKKSSTSGYKNWRDNSESKFRYEENRRNTNFNQSKPNKFRNQSKGYSSFKKPKVIVDEKADKNGWKKTNIKFQSSNQQIGTRIYHQNEVKSDHITFSEFVKSNKPKQNKELTFTKTKVDNYKFDPIELSEKYEIVYGNPELEPVHLSSNLEIKAGNANCTGPQDRVVHAVALEECGGQMLNVFNTPNIVEVHTELSKSKKKILSKSSQKIILNNSIKVLTKIVIPEINDNFKDMKFQVDPSKIGKHILDISDHPRLSSMIRNPEELFGFKNRIRLRAYTEYIKHALKNQWEAYLLSELYLNATLAYSRISDCNNSQWLEFYPFDQKRFKKYISQCQKELKSVNLLKEQFCKFSHRIFPQNPFQSREKKLDQWQVELLKMMHNLGQQESIVVTAPTGTGKTAVSCSYIVNTAKRMIYISPNDTLARQQCGDFKKSGHSAALLLEDEVFWVNNPDIIVGTPSMVATYFSKKHCDASKFEWIVVDEVHQIKQSGEDLDQASEAKSLQILLKKFMGTTKFLLLSATIPDPENLRLWAEKLTDRKAYLCQYNRRFTALRHYRFNSTQAMGKRLEKFSVLAGVDLDFVKMGGLTQSSFNLPPEEVWTHSTSSLLKDHITSPDVFFKDKIHLTLFDIQDYEILWKQELTKLAINESTQDIVSNFLAQFNVSEEPVPVSLFSVLTTLRKRKAYPAILFYENTTECESNFAKLVTFLEDEEKRLYPERLELLRFLGEKYDKAEEFIEKRLEKLDVPEKERNNAAGFLAKKRKDLEQGELDSIRSSFSTKIKRIIGHLTTKYNLTGKELVKSTKYYQGLETWVKGWTSPVKPDEYTVMPDLSFFIKGIQVTDDQKRSFRRLIDKIQQKNAITSKGKKKQRYGYTSLTMRGIERGVVVYTKNTTAAEQQAIQCLFNQGKVQFLISDHEMAQGVNTPAKAAVLMGKESTSGVADSIRNMSVLKASQMIGRAGRRGYHDKGGVVIHVGVNTKDILRSTYESIAETKIIDTTLMLPNQFNKIQHVNYCQRVLDKPMVGFTTGNYQQNYEHQLEYIRENHLYTEHKQVCHLIWSMRKFGDKAYMAPVIGVFLADQFKTANDVNSMVSIFRIFSSIFDPKYIDSDIIIESSKEIKHFKLCLDALNQEINLDTNLGNMFRSNKIETLDIIDKSITLQRLLYIARAISIFHNWHKEKFNSGESNQEVSKNNCKRVASLVMPTFLRLLALISKFN